MSITGLFFFTIWSLIQVKKTHFLPLPKKVLYLLWHMKKKFFTDYKTKKINVWRRIKNLNSESSKKVFYLSRHMKKTNFHSWKCFKFFIFHLCNRVKKSSQHLSKFNHLLFFFFSLANQNFFLVLFFFTHKNVFFFLFHFRFHVPCVKPSENFY